MKFIRSFNSHAARAWLVTIVIGRNKSVSSVPFRVAKCSRPLERCQHALILAARIAFNSINYCIIKFRSEALSHNEDSWWILVFLTWRTIQCSFFNNGQGFSPIDVRSLRERELSMRAIIHAIDNELKTITVHFDFILCVLLYDKGSSSCRWKRKSYSYQNFTQLFIAATDSRARVSVGHSPF